MTVEQNVDALEKLTALRQTTGAELGIFEIALGAFVLAEEERAVRVIKIEGVAERAAHARIGELRFPRIDGEGLHA